MSTKTGILVDASGEKLRLSTKRAILVDARD
jgi:hypothetical protein